MTRIRVNTEDLLNKAKDFDSAAEAFKRAGDDILAAAMAMPSYDGQLSGPARKMGYEYQKQARELSTALAGDAESLRKSAQAFEEVDNQTVNTFSINQAVLSTHMAANKELFAPATKTKGGNACFGYEYLSPDIIVIWSNGRYIRVTLKVPPLTTDEYQKVMELIGHIDAFDTLLQSFPEQYRGIVEDAGIAIVLLVITGVPIVGLVAAVKALASFIDTFKDWQGIDETWDKLRQEAISIGNGFNELFNSNSSGIETVDPTPAYPP
jgi:uncharacterized protein YukE